MTEWNENLTPWKSPKPTNRGGAGTIESYESIENIVWQTRIKPPTDYENSLADALEQILMGTHELPEIVNQLNNLGIRSPSGEPFTEESFKAELARLAAA